MEAEIREIFKKYETEEYIGKSIIDFTNYPKSIYVLEPYEDTKKKRLSIYIKGRYTIHNHFYGANHQYTYYPAKIKKGYITINIPEELSNVDFSNDYDNYLGLYPIFLGKHLCKQILDLGISFRSFHILCRGYESCFYNNGSASNLSKLLNLNYKYIKVAIDKHASFSTIKYYREKGFTLEELSTIPIIYDATNWTLNLNKEQLMFVCKLESEGHNCYVYRDYLGLREWCKDITNKKYPLIPKQFEDVNDFHDELTDIYNQYQSYLRKKELQSKTDEYLEKYYPLAKEYEYENDKYSIIACSDLSDLIREGKELHHCVGTYVDSVFQGREYILFLREKTNIDKSFFTIDIDTNKKVRQIHGLCNCNLTEELKPFIKKWAKTFKLNITNCSGVHCALY